MKTKHLFENTITSWLEDYERKVKSLGRCTFVNPPLLITGPSRCGKKSTLKQILLDRHYTPVVIDDINILKKNYLLSKSLVPSTKKSRTTNVFIVDLDSLQCLPRIKKDDSCLMCYVCVNIYTFPWRERIFNMRGLVHITLDKNTYQPYFPEENPVFHQLSVRDVVDIPPWDVVRTLSKTKPTGVDLQTKIGIATQHKEKLFDIYYNNIPNGCKTMDQAALVTEHISKVDSVTGGHNSIRYKTAPTDLVVTMEVLPLSKMVREENSVNGFNYVHKTKTLKRALHPRVLIIRSESEEKCESPSGPLKIQRKMTKFLTGDKKDKSPCILKRE